MIDRWQRVKRLARAGFLLREVRGLRTEVERLASGVERIAAALELQNAHQWPVPQQASPDAPLVEITHVDDQMAEEFMSIELGLTQAKGLPPSEDEILQEYDRRHGHSEGSA